MRCPICKAQGTESRDQIDEKDTKGHLESMHIKSEIAQLCARILWGDGDAKE